MSKTYLLLRSLLTSFILLVTFNIASAQSSSFTVNDSAQCLPGNSYVFTNTSTGSGNTYAWSFGDGTTSTVSNPTKVYTLAGTYSVQLITTNAGTDYYSNRTISVDPLPVASFNSIANTQSGGSYTFISTSTISSGSMTYAWDFGDGTSSTLINPNKNYFANGTYNVTLTVTSNGGCVSTSTQSINVTIGSLISGFNLTTPTNQCISGNSFVFTNESSTGVGVTYSWNFGAGATPATFSGATPPVVTYSTSGFKTVTLTTTAPGPLTAVSTQTLTVVANPVASLTLSNVNNYFTFNSTSINATNIAWNFGNGNTGNGTSVNHTYTTAGTYTVKLYASAANCVDSVSQVIVAPAPAPPPTAPVASFSVATPTGQCAAGNSYSFTNTSTGTGNTYQWSFPNATPSSSTLANPSGVVFNGYGIYNVTLVSTNAGGSSSSTQTVVVGPRPTSSFSYSNLLNAYTFFNGSYIAQDTIASYAWALNGTTFSTLKNPPVQTLGSGVNVIRLIAISTLGCADTSTQTIGAVVVPPPVNNGPVAIFSVSSATSQCVAGNSFTFTNTSTGAGNSYQWTFPNATPSSSNLANPGAVIFNGYGTYTVTLVATNAFGNATTTQVVKVGTKPTASFSSSNTGSNYTFFNGSYIAMDTISTYNWTLHGLSFSSAKNPPVQSLTVGTHRISLIATSPIGCIDSVSQLITVLVVTPPPPPSGAPVSSFTITTLQTQCLSGNSYTFNNTSTGVANTYAWTFAGGTPSTSTSANPGTVTFATAGSHLVTLVATNVDGSTTSTQSAIIANPTASFTTYSNTNTGNSYTFVSTSTVPTGNMTYSWDFGDGSPASGLVNPTHTYAAPGTYTVTLTVTGTSGCPASTSSSTVTFCPKATASFAVSSTQSQCLTGNSFTFTNNSSNNAGIPQSGMTYLWNFGDGTTSTLLTPPAKTYAVWGDYDVKLYTTLVSGGCTHTDSMTIFKAVSAEPMPVASYNLYLDTYLQATALYSDTVKRCFRPGMDFAYHSSSTVARGQMAIRKWSFQTAALSFREGDSVNYHNPRIIFDTAGTYHVKHTITSDKGCKDSVIRVVRLSDPRSIFLTDTIFTPNAYAAPQVVLTNNSRDYGGRLVSWNWSFGGVGASPASSVLQNPTNVTYNCGGTKTITLTVTSDIGCVHTSTNNVVIKIKPVAGFAVGAANYTPQPYSRPTFQMTNTTTSADICPTYTYAWDFGDATTSSSANPSKIWTGSGTYTVGLLVTNTNGGKIDYISNNVLVAIRPRALFSTSVAAATPNGTRLVTLTNASTSADANAAIAVHAYSVSWGDGSPIETGTGVGALTHNYASGGTYTISLTMTNLLSGLISTVNGSVTANIQPLAGFTTSAATFSPDAYAQPSYDFTNTSSISNDASGSLTYAWNFGVGASPATSTTTNPTGVVYTSSGTKTVTLTTTNTYGGLTHVSTQNVVVGIKPKAAFTSSVSGGIYDNPTVDFIDGTTINESSPNLTYLWNFGAGATPATSTAQNPTGVTYAAGGTKNVTLTVTNTFTGGTTTDNISNNVVIVITPRSRISVQNTVVAIPVPFNIGAMANYQSYTITGISNGANPSTIVSGSIVSSLIEIDYTEILPVPQPTVINWVSQAGAAFTDVNFSIEDAIKANYTFTIRLYTTSDLGVTDLTSITIANGVQTGGFTYRLAANSAPITTPQVTIPAIRGTRNLLTPAVVINTPALKGFVVYPNPTKDKIQVSFESLVNTQTINVQIFDLNGKVVRSQKQAANVGSRQNITMDVNNLAAGTYSIVLVDDKGAKIGISKFIKPIK